MIIFKYLKVDFTVESGWFCECVCVSSKTSSKHVASCVASDSEITTATSASSGLPIPGQGDFLEESASVTADTGEIRWFRACECRSLQAELEHCSKSLTLSFRAGVCKPYSSVSQLFDYDSRKRCLRELRFTNPTAQSINCSIMRAESDA